MRILHLTEKDYKTSAWSGGTTTELFIWPEGADYGKREFSFRISSATVDLEDSDFTPLAGVTRYITPLTGGFTLTHPGKAAVVMGPVDAPYRFSGEEATHCVGRATDFNLMLKGLEGEMTICCGRAAIRPGFNSFYALEECVCSLEGRHAMGKGDLLVVFAEEAGEIDLGGRAIACRAEI
jgi:environmental stress-induced protein Ves